MHDKDEGEQCEPKNAGHLQAECGAKKPHSIGNHFLYATLSHCLMGGNHSG